MTQTRLRRVGKAITPPVVVKAIRGLSRRAPSEWRYNEAGWPQASAELGWEHPEIAAMARSRWHHFRRSVEAPLPLGRSNEDAHPSGPNYAVHNTFLSFAYAFARAAGPKSHITMLDWGGGLGEYLLLANALFPDVSVTYTCKEQPSMVAIGSDLHAGTVFTDDSSRALSARYDLIVASSSMHYEQQWQTTFAGLAAAAQPWLYITRTPIAHDVADFVVTQRAHAYGYPTEYPGWVLNRRGLLELAAARSLSLEREFLIDERPTVPGAPEQPEYRGFLFRRRSAESA